jgi:anti-sigma factor RsiW
MAEACPEENMLGAYIEHNLLPEEQQQVEAHLVECRRCRKMIAAVIKTMGMVADPGSAGGES